MANSSPSIGWHWTGTRPSARYAALWLLARVLDCPGPFTPLKDAQRRLVANVAEGAAARIDHALQLARITRPLAEQCACGGRLVVDGGDGEPPLVRCLGCHRRVTAQAEAVRMASYDEDGIAKLTAIAAGGAS